MKKEKKKNNKIKSFGTKAKKKTKNFLNEFKKFAFKGNIVDLAIAVVIGAAFGAIVTSLVSDIIMPWVSLLIGDVSFVDLKWVLKPATAGKSEIAFRYGSFLQKVFEFIIIAFSIFITIKIFNSAKEKFDEKEKDSETQIQIKTENKTEILLTEIRDLLIEQNSNKAEEKITKGENADGKD